MRLVELHGAVLVAWGPVCSFFESCLVVQKIKSDELSRPELKVHDSNSSIGKGGFGWTKHDLGLLEFLNLEISGTNKSRVVVFYLVYLTVQRNKNFCLQLPTSCSAALSTDWENIFLILWI